MHSKQKLTGAYYTPRIIAETLVSWVVKRETDRLLDPSCGDGRFIGVHGNSFGVENDEAAASAARSNVPTATVHVAEFFYWAAATTERFECCAGNPPFIRYQAFTGDIRNQALLLCRSQGAHFSGLASSWAPFLVAAASLLKHGGRLAFVVPAEIGHAPYAAPLLEFLAANFAEVEIVAVRNKLFPELSEDCWLLYADGFGGRTAEFGLTAVDSFIPTSCPPRGPIRIPVSEWRTIWNKRLRPFLLPSSVRDIYRKVASTAGTMRFGDAASINIGYVTGANEFFHLRPSMAAQFDIPADFLHPSVRNSRSLTQRAVTQLTVDNWKLADNPALLLRLPQAADLPEGVKKYLETDEGHKARTAYKCRMRSPWYSVPDVKVPDFFLTYMSGLSSQLVRNSAGCVCTNALHTVRIKNKENADRIMSQWESTFVRLSCEIEGHPLGGGMLKLEPREAGQVVIPFDTSSEELNNPAFAEGLRIMRSWRHYES